MVPRFPSGAEPVDVKRFFVVLHGEISMLDTIEKFHVPPFPAPLLTPWKIAEKFSFFAVLLP